MDIIDLITQCINNNKDAWKKFVLTYSKFIKNVIYKYFNNLNEIDDIIQEVFIRLLKNDFSLLKNFKGDTEYSFLSYLRSITISTTKNYIRKNNKNEISIDKIKLNKTTENPLDTLLKKMSIKKLMKAIYKLPIKYRDVMILLSRGYKQREIAEILNINIKTVATRISRGKEKIKIFLKEFC